MAQFDMLDQLKKQNGSKNKEIKIYLAKQIRLLEFVLALI